MSYTYRNCCDISHIFVHFKTLNITFYLYYFIHIDYCLLSNNIYDYHIVSQGKVTVASIDDNEEFTLTDVISNFVFIYFSLLILKLLTPLMQFKQQQYQYYQYCSCINNLTFYFCSRFKRKAKTHLRKFQKKKML